MSAREHISLKTKLASALKRIRELEVYLAAEKARHAKSRSDIVGQQFGRLLVTDNGMSRTYRSGRRDWLWKCQCDCGAIVFATTTVLRNGNTKSCGCFQRELQSKLKRTHGMTKSGIYKCWGGMIQRCTNNRQTQYKDYGGRGIKVCERWRMFENFYADMGPRPSPQHELDRKDNNGNYEPGNVRWATSKQNSRNRRNTVFLTLNGRRLCIQSWAEITGLKERTIKSRLRIGWGVERALTVGAVAP